MKKVLNFSGWGIFIILVIWFSLKIENMEQHRAKSGKPVFDATVFAQKFGETELPACIRQAISVQELMKHLGENPEQCCATHGHQLGISKTWYFTIKGTGTIDSVKDECLVISVSDNLKVNLATDFIFGNAIRDGSGKVNISDFVNMTDFNNVSVAINKLAREKVAARLKKLAVAGQTIEFAGAFEFSEENSNIENMLIIPVSAKISDGKSQ